MRGTHIAVVAGERAYTFTISASAVRAVLTKRGTWFGSVSVATNGPMRLGVAVEDRIPYVSGNCQWWSDMESVQLLLYGRDHLLFHVECVT